MAAWSKRYGQVPLDDGSGVTEQNVESGSRFTKLIPDWLRHVGRKKYIPLLFWLTTAILFSAAIVMVLDILSNLNRDIDPCDNFYEFACGGWEENNPIPDGKDWWDTFDKQEKRINDIALDMMKEGLEETENAALKQAKLFYRNCMEIDKPDPSHQESVLEVLTDTLEFYGGWPIISRGDKWNTSNFSWMKSLVDLKRRFNTPSILDINSYRTVTGKNVINITKPVTEYYIERLISAPTTDYIVSLSKQLINSEDEAYISEDRLEEQAYGIIKVCNDLMYLNKFHYIGASEIRRQYGFTENFGYTKLNRLQNLLNSSENTIQLLELLVILYENSGVEITENTTVYVNDINYILNLQDYMASLDQTTLANFLHFKMVHTMIPYTTLKLRELFAKIVLKGIRVNINMGEAECIGDVQRRLRFVLEPKLVEKELGSAACFKNSRDKVIRMFVKLIKGFRNAKYTSAVLHQNQEANICIGFPEWLFDDNRLQMEYGGLNLTQPTYMEQVLAFNEWQTTKEQRRPSIPLWMNECDWSRIESGIAFANLEFDQVYLNWKMLTPPWFGIGRQDKSHNDGALGAALSHELVHLLDRFAQPYSNIGTTDEELCLMKHYQNFSAKAFGRFEQNLNGKHTLRENLADNAGLQLAYMAFKQDRMIRTNHNAQPVGGVNTDEFTADQKFFIGFAQSYCHVNTLSGMKYKLDKDSHSPGKFRVLGTLQNSNDFSKAWNCPVGSNMNPAAGKHEKCIFVSD